MLTSSTSSRHELRRLLRAVLPTDSDFNAFCLDFFPEVAERFAGGMDRVEKSNLLFQLAEQLALLDALQRHGPKLFEQYQQQNTKTTISKKNPYRGLSAFQQDEAHLFFGREALTAQLWQRYETLWETPGAVRLLAILGPSGSGKSSVARAGLLATLAVAPLPGPQPLCIAVLKPGKRPIESLARALLPLMPQDNADLAANRQVALERLLTNKDVPGQGLRRFAADLPQSASSPLLVLVDQFEELYTLCKDPVARDLFVETLLHAASDSGRHVSIVLTLRTDFIGEMQHQHAEFSRLVGSQHEIVSPMTIDELRDAIAKPAEHAGRPIDETTVELLLSESKGNQGALPLLEFALTRIWEGIERGEEPGVTLRRIGGVGGALASEAQKIFTSLTDGEQSTTRRALVRLVRLGHGTRDTRRRVLLSELCGRGETEAVVSSVLRKFAGEKVRLVTLGREGPETVAEVTHEALFEHWTELRSWIEQSRQDRGLLDRAQEAARLWDRDGRPVGRLWRPPDLDLLRAYEKRKPDDLSPLLALFLSTAEKRQKQERTLIIGALGFVVLAVLGAAGIYVAKERQRTQEAAAAKERIRQQLLDTYVERGQQLLFDKKMVNEALLWLHRAQGEGSRNSALPDLLRSAMENVDAARSVLVGHTKRVGSATFSSDSRRILTSSADGTARVWDVASGRLLSAVAGHLDSVLSASFSPDSRRILTSSADKTARMWDAASGRPLAELRGHQAWVWSARFSSDGQRILTGSWDNTARVWDAQSGRLLFTLMGHQESVMSASLSPDGRRIVTTSGDQTARVWDIDSGRLLTELTGHRDSIWKGSFSSDGKRILTASLDSTARVWDAQSGRLLVVLTGHRASVVSASFSSDGRRIVTASFDHTAREWDANSGSLLVELTGHRDRLWGAEFSPDAKHIVTASDDRTARVWEAGSGRMLTELVGHSDSVTRSLLL